MSVVDIASLIAQANSLFASWPVVPAEQRPKRLPHIGAITESDSAMLQAKGWEPIDVRLMPNATDAERGMSLKATLEGIRLGTIEAEPKIQKFLDLEARALGLTSARGPSEDKPKDEIDKESLSTIFGAMLDTKPTLLKETKKTGRPPGSKTKD